MALFSVVSFCKSEHQQQETNNNLFFVLFQINKYGMKINKQIND